MKQCKVFLWNTEYWVLSTVYNDVEKKEGWTNPKFKFEQLIKHSVSVELLMRSGSQFKISWGSRILGTGRTESNLPGFNGMHTNFFVAVNLGAEQKLKNEGIWYFLSAMKNLWILRLYYSKWSKKGCIFRKVLISILLLLE